jgi:hypothetical protein
MHLPTTNHGRVRVQQRGVRTRVLEIVWAHADVALHAGNGCETFRLSRHKARDLVARGELNSDDAGRACRIALVVGQWGLISALHPMKGKRGRRYRRQLDTRARRISGGSR